MYKQIDGYLLLLMRSKGYLVVSLDMRKEEKVFH